MDDIRDVPPYWERSKTPKQQRSYQRKKESTRTSSQSYRPQSPPPTQGRGRRGPPPPPTQRKERRVDYDRGRNDNENDTDHDDNEPFAGSPSSVPDQSDLASQYSDEDSPHPEEKGYVESDRDYEAVYRPIMKMQPDWRGEICGMLDISPGLSDAEIVAASRRAAKVLKQAEHWRSEAKALQKPPRYQIIHSVSCHRSGRRERLFRNPPQVVNYGPYSAHLRTDEPIEDFPVFMAENKEIVFLVYKDYRCCDRNPTQQLKGKSGETTEVDASSLLIREEISIIAPGLKSAMDRLGRAALSGISHPDFLADKPISYPYIWWFHRRNEIDMAMSDLSFPPIMNLMRDYVCERMDKEWTSVDQLLDNNKITAQYMDYLFVSHTSRSFLDSLI
ncbi:hypothetical protein NW752_001466 [Fusarium irregulare]|uniref:Uncharacterized protein n=1 Tax=Fusarium irregulare TaxID=2494466 RepID=A0A9W8UC24_9HYPO|nr:hypothetical protein NW766_003623 [Fusarium irregulare]KAJ4026516.1 hypothetical protein NW752_001466 [Fusarium irregulare]